MKLKPKVIIEETPIADNKDLTEVSEIVATIAEVERTMTVQENALKTSKDTLRRLVEEDLPNKLAEIGLTKVETTNGDKVEVKPFYRGHISKERIAEAFKWLTKNAARFHFKLSFNKDNKHIDYEPWHWRYEGSIEALKVFESSNSKL